MELFLLDSTLPSGLYGEHEGGEAEEHGDEKRRRQAWNLAHPGGMAQIEQWRSAAMP